jgi:hypothetical protein
MEDMDFDDLLLAVVVDHLDIQTMDLNFDKDWMIVYRDFVGNCHLLELVVVVVVDIQFVEENKMNNCPFLVVDYLMNKDLYKVKQMGVQPDKVIVKVDHPGTVIVKMDRPDKVVGKIVRLDKVVVMFDLLDKVVVMIVHRDKVFVMIVLLDKVLFEWVAETLN